MMENSFWQDARPQRRGWMARGDRAVAVFNASHAPAEPEPVAPDMVAGLDLAAYAQHRDELGIRSAGEFVGLDSRTPDASGFPDAAGSILTREQRAQLGLGHLNHERPGPEPRQPGIPAAAMPTSLGGIPMRGVVHHENNSK